MRNYINDNIKTKDEWERKFTEDWINLHQRNPVDLTIANVIAMIKPIIASALSLQKEELIERVERYETVNVMALAVKNSILKILKSK